MRIPDNLPPLAALRVFEAVGRLRSFRKASEELCISQSAVSYHIKNLEEEVGVKLFNRHARGIAFTTNGESYWSAVRDAFGVIEKATAGIRPPSGVQVVRLSVLPSFATGWLVAPAAFLRRVPSCPGVHRPTARTCRPGQRGRRCGDPLRTWRLA